MWDSSEFALFLLWGLFPSHFYKVTFLEGGWSNCAVKWFDDASFSVTLSFITLHKLITDKKKKTFTIFFYARPRAQCVRLIKRKSLHSGQDIGPPSTAKNRNKSIHMNAVNWVRLSESEIYTSWLPADNGWIWEQSSRINKKNERR